MNESPAHSISNSGGRPQAQALWDNWRKTTPHPGQVMLADVWPFLVAGAVMVSLLFVPEIGVRAVVGIGTGMIGFLFITERVRNKRKWADKFLRESFGRAHPAESALLWRDGT